MLSEILKIYLRRNSCFISLWPTVCNFAKKQTLSIIINDSNLQEIDLHESCLDSSHGFPVSFFVEFLGLKLVFIVKSYRKQYIILQ